jgi:hypothetical protein
MAGASPAMTTQSVRALQAGITSITICQNAVIFFTSCAQRATLCVTTTRQNRNTSLEYARQLRKG